MMQQMMECVISSSVLMAFSGVVFLAMQRGWATADVSPRECLRFWRNVMRGILNAIRQ